MNTTNSVHYSHTRSTTTNTSYSIHNLLQIIFLINNHQSIIVVYSEHKVMNFNRLEDLQTYIYVIFDLKLVWQSKQHFIFYGFEQKTSQYEQWEKSNYRYVVNTSNVRIHNRPCLYSFRDVLLAELCCKRNSPRRRNFVCDELKRPKNCDQSISSLNNIYI
jgi:hypothetical protein